MTTGDLKNNLRKLVSELKQIRYPQSELDIKGVAQGIPKAFLPIVHHVFLDYSILLAQYFASKEYDLYGKTDLRFMETVYKVLRDEFGYKPQLTREQFLAIGFAERKIILLCAILKLLREKHDELNPKGGKSEKKKVKQSCVNAQLNGTNINGTTKESHSKKDISTSFDQFPAPLPVDTHMKRFRSNGEALKAGLGLREPLVTRAFVVDGEHENHFIPGADSDKGPTSGKVISTEGNPFPSNLIVKTTNDQQLFGKKFPVSQNAEIRSNLSNQFHVKSVTWEDQVRDSQSRQSELCEKAACKLPPTPISVPVRIHDNPNSVTPPAYYPLALENAVSTGMNPHLAPFPVTMTTAPKPSPDLMLTPTVKTTRHEAILHSSSDSQGASHSDDKFPCTRVVRHSKPIDIDAPDVCVVNAGLSAETQVCTLKQQVQELQEKFESMVLQNNEMSARVVLLESKVKLLEEVCERKSCCNCRSPQATISTKEDASKYGGIHAVVSGFNVRGETRSIEQSPVNSLACIPAEINGVISNACNNDASHKSTGRKLFKETVTSFDNDSASHSEKSDEDNDNDDDGDSYGTGKVKSVSSNEQDASIILSPLPSVSKLSGVFADPSTKNTVVNVHKRLQETRELLARTNRDFAARFYHYQVE